MSSTTTTNLHKVNTTTSSSTSTSSQEGSTSCIAIYIDENTNTDSHPHAHAHAHDSQDESTDTHTELINHHANNNNNHTQRFHKHSHSNSSLFGHDYIKNFVILSKLNLYSPQEYYSNIQLSQLPFINHKWDKKHKSDCPSDISLSSIDSKYPKAKQNKIRKLMLWMKYINSTICYSLNTGFHFLLLTVNKFQKWQKELHEAPLEVKEKYFFVLSTVISTVLFYILFLCLDIMIKHWFALPTFITDCSFTISYCISYLTSVIWQHFFNQYFIFEVDTNNNYFCDSLLRTYLVYAGSLLITGILGSILQYYLGIADELVLFLTLPISGCINYYLLHYCHAKHAHAQKNYHKYKQGTQLQPRHMQREKFNKNYKNIKKKHNVIDDIVIV